MNKFKAAHIALKEKKRSSSYLQIYIVQNETRKWKKQSPAKKRKKKLSKKDNVSARKKDEEDDWRVLQNNKLYR